MVAIVAAAFVACGFDLAGSLDAAPVPADGAAPIRDRDGDVADGGGELMVSRDALARLEDRLTTDHPKDLDGAVDETLGARGVALLGVRSLVSIRDVIAEALDARQ